MDRVAARILSDGTMFMTTRYIPKRHEDIVGKGSLYWIIKHQLVARAPILGFEPNSEGRHNILLDPVVIPVRVKARRAHQGWRYLEQADAPHDLLGDGQASDDIPADLLSDLAGLYLI